MTLTQLYYFHAVCQFQSITGAADSLHISQPSISAAIKELENEFGVILFTRLYKGTVPTQEGMRLFELAGSLLEQAERLCQIMKDVGQKRKLLRLGMPPMIGSLLLPRIHREFFAKNPEIQVQITEGGRDRLLHDLAENTIDLMFLPHDTPFGDGYKALPVMQLEATCCVSENHPLSSLKTISVEDLRDEPLVMFKNSFFQTQKILQRFKEKSITPNVIFYTDQLSTMEEMTANGLSIGFMFRQISDSVPHIVNIPFDPPLKSQVSVVWRSGGYLFNDMNRFLTYVKNTSFQMKPKGDLK